MKGRTPAAQRDEYEWTSTSCPLSPWGALILAFLGVWFLFKPSQDGPRHRPGAAAP